MVRVCAIQMASTQDINDNLVRALELINQAALAGARLIVLPENFLTFGLTPGETLHFAQSAKNLDCQNSLAQAAEKHKIWLVGGTLPVPHVSLAHKIYSRCFVWGPTGEVITYYDKIHLFDVVLPEGESYQESTQIIAGEKIVSFDTPFGKVGVVICYDLRFPELFRTLLYQGVEIFVVPAAFTMNTGQVHWEVLLKARAIENLCYLIASAETGIRFNGAQTYGHSMIVSPWGKIIASQAQGDGAVLGEIDREGLVTLRRHFPVLSHSRTSVMEAFIKARERSESRL